MELERVVIGLVTAALLPYSIPMVRPRRVTALALTAGYALYSLAPGLLSWAALLLLALCLGASWLLGRLAKADANMQGSPRLFRPAGTARFIYVPFALAVLLALASGLLYGGALLTRATGELILDDSTALVVSGLLVATFVGGEVVTHTLHPFYAELKKAEAEEMEPLRGAGTAIGWLERSMTYAFAVAGQPEAVAVVVGIKALARFPELKSNQKRFAEYFLIGSMSSIGFALLVAAVVRVLLGERALG
ncbi:hypothetical protein J0910_09365 [Nocardiopsis sp. CNT-189]|uniref:hypothetical protein n=1 Tax=Nocardiopsis oceanisediminis TaxID=2816862 RepID=UPI003B29AC9D